MRPTPVTIAVAIAAEAVAETAEQQDDKGDDEMSPVDITASLCEQEPNQALCRSGGAIHPSRTERPIALRPQECAAVGRWKSVQKGPLQRSLGTFADWSFATWA
jgi:hypothetical protein